MGVWNELLRIEHPFSQPFFDNEAVARGTPFTSLQALDQHVWVTQAVECPDGKDCTKSM